MQHSNFSQKCGSGKCKVLESRIVLSIKETGTGIEVSRSPYVVQGRMNSGKVYLLILQAT